MVGTYDVYRDADGNPVTITHEQMEAIWHAIRVRDQINERHHPNGDRQGAGSGGVNWLKSRLLGRMLLDGLPPLPDPPPVRWGGPAYHLTDPDLCPVCGGFRTDVGGALCTTIVPPDEATMAFIEQSFTHWESGDLAGSTDFPDGWTVSTVGRWETTPASWRYRCVMPWHAESE